MEIRSTLSFIQGGRDKVRRMLYMPALAAIRCNPVLAQKYAALLAAGKPPKVAITAVMKKLLGPARSGRAVPLVRLRWNSLPAGNRIRVQVYLAPRCLKWAS